MGEVLTSSRVLHWLCESSRPPLTRGREASEFTLMRTLSNSRIPSFFSIPNFEFCKKHFEPVRLLVQLLSICPSTK
ncbi:hypothetical protein TWF102_009577 [Orbilia oligospora]|uniref:Uncharacterized protein n=1 Tax=Orbilia oligospora TaxID=2813651 RepID=A0A7C8N738_ORBOL|nr:hypothetical protein TWF102_009577 [Orbilia oligospora]KAF3100034.1 hypothetical protein TWF103_008541 [Orbilia oligospora]KAF3138091.1 hypothetical protein TWF594_007344 [Orbilia oligospora]